MKYYRCDSCEKEFSADDGMIQGWYTENIETAWSIPDNTKYNIIIKKTIKLHRKIPATAHFAGHEQEAEIDLCPTCVKRLIK